MGPWLENKKCSKTKIGVCIPQDKSICCASIQHERSKVKVLIIIIIIIIIMTRRQLRSVATTLYDDRDPVPSSTPV